MTSLSLIEDIYADTATSSTCPMPKPPKIKGREAPSQETFAFVMASIVDRKISTCLK